VVPTVRVFVTMGDPTTNARKWLGCLEAAWDPRGVPRWRDDEEISPGEKFGGGLCPKTADPNNQTMSPAAHGRGIPGLLLGRGEGRGGGVGDPVRLRSTKKI
jgi:hypothetical protein